MNINNLIRTLIEKTSYLDWLDWTPEQIVLIDDGIHHLESVKNELERRGIPFLGFLYIPKDLDPIDEKVAELQHEIIINNRRWISDQEAKSFLYDDVLEDIFVVWFLWWLKSS